MSEERKALEKLICRLLGATVIVGLVVLLLPQFWDKLSPFILAIPIAALLQPVIRFLQEKLKLKRSVASLILVLLILALLLVLPCWKTAVR